MIKNVCLLFWGLAEKTHHSWSMQLRHFCQCGRQQARPCKQLFPRVKKKQNTRGQHQHASTSCLVPTQGMFPRQLDNLIQTSIWLAGSSKPSLSSSVILSFVSCSSWSAAAHGSSVHCAIIEFSNMQKLCSPLSDRAATCHQRKDIELHLNLKAMEGRYSLYFLDIIFAAVGFLDQVITLLIAMGMRWIRFCTFIQEPGSEWCHIVSAPFLCFPGLCRA